MVATVLQTNRGWDQLHIYKRVAVLLANAVHCRRAGKTTICACVHCVVAWVSKVAGEGEVGDRINGRM